jgi:hypothetical protein
VDEAKRELKEELIKLRRKLISAAGPNRSVRLGEAFIMKNQLVIPTLFRAGSLQYIHDTGKEVVENSFGKFIPLQTGKISWLCFVWDLTGGVASITEKDIKAYAKAIRAFQKGIDFVDEHSKEIIDKALIDAAKKAAKVED